MLILLSPLLGYVEAQETNIDVGERIDAYLTRNVENGYIGAVLVERNGEVILSSGYGLADSENNVPVTASTVFNIGSVTKQFTAAAVLLLAERNELELTATLADYFESVPADKKGITIHQLLTHTSGISVYAGGFRYEYVSREQFVSELFETELVAAPGTEHHYANAGYTLLAAIIEIVSKKPYEAFLSENIFTPLQMLDTGYKIPEWEDKVVAHSYYYSLADTDWFDWGTTPERWEDNEVSWYGIGKGDIQSTVEDLYKWHKALENNVILSEESRTQFETPYVSENPQGNTSYAYGWSISTSRRNTKVVSHDGSNDLYFADFIRFVDEDAVVISLSSVSYISFRARNARRQMLNGNDIDLLARVVGRMVFDSDYEPISLPRPNSYELVFEFISQNSPESVGNLNNYFVLRQEKNIRDSALLNRIGLHLLNNEEWEWALALLSLNVELFSQDGNLWDTLGEAYMARGDYEQAKASLDTALELAPSDGCSWCQNSRRMLGEIESIEQATQQD